MPSDKQFTVISGNSSVGFQAAYCASEPMTALGAPVIVKEQGENMIKLSIMMGCNPDDRNIINPLIKKNSNRFDVYWKLPKDVNPASRFVVVKKLSDLLTIAIGIDKNRFKADDFKDCIPCGPGDQIELFDTTMLEDSMFLFVCLFVLS